MSKTIVYQNPITEKWFFDYNEVKKQLESKGYEEVLVAKIQDKEKAMFTWQSLEDYKIPLKFSELLYYMNFMEVETITKKHRKLNKYRITLKYADTFFANQGF
jgi:hypothetical protein